MIVDTSVFIDLERSGHGPVDLGRAYPDAEFALAAITLSELLIGALHANTLERRRQRAAFADRLARDIAVIPFDERVARQYAPTLFSLSRASQMIDIHDLQIAATAITERAAVLTRDVRDFPNVPDLEVQVFDLAFLDERSGP